MNIPIKFIKDDVSRRVRNAHRNCLPFLIKPIENLVLELLVLKFSVDQLEEIVICVQCVLVSEMIYVSFCKFEADHMLVR